MKAGFFTLGCKVNIYETENLMNSFEEAGYEIVSFDEKADIFVINTCSVTNQSDVKARKVIRKCRNENKDAIMIVMGCYSQLNIKEIQKIAKIDILIGNHEKIRVVELLEKYLIDKKMYRSNYDLTKVNYEVAKINKFFEHTRSFVKIQDGCENYCSYCVIPFARGRCRSKPLEIVIEEVKNLVCRGYKEVVLTGIHTGNYGTDIGTSLAKLLKELEKIDSLERIRLSSIEITEIDDEMLDVISVSGKIVDHLHIPLQSGSNKTLKEMNRKYDLVFYKNKLKEIRSIRPKISITTDVIVGFPGESIEDFEETVNTVKECNFSKLHVFPYSIRTGTVAAKRKDQIHGSIKKYRAKKLLDLSNKLEEEYRLKFIGTKMDVLVEEYSDGYVFGYTRNYLRVKGLGKIDNCGKIMQLFVNEIE